MARAIHSMIRVNGERRSVDSRGSAFGLDVTHTRFERAGFEARDTVEFNREGAQFDGGTAENRAPTINVLAIRRADVTTSEKGTGNL